MTGYTTANHPPSEKLMWAATGLAERGWHIFPCVPGGKRPALREDWERRATTDTGRIARCWATGPYNIGIACGPSGLVVIDLDTAKPGQQAPAGWDIPGIRDGADTLAALCQRHGQPIPFGTFMTQTPSGGMHLYFTAPDGAQLRNTAGRLAWLIDTRAAGGYVVGPGSLIDGRAYTIANPAPPAPLPGWLARLLADPAPATGTPGAVTTVTGPARYAITALRGETQRVLDAAEGTRNDTLNHAAFACGQLAAAGLLPMTLAYDALLTAARQAGLTPREADRTIRSGLTSGTRKPRGAAA
jgi:Bifunctional DNA primase/polymerase, N-terminal